MLKGTGAGGQRNAMQQTSRVRSWLQGEGSIPSHIHESRVIDVNLVNWTVDVVTTFDPKRYFDIQVCSPYMHPNNGDGISVMPEIGSKCLVCIPSDGPPPFVLGFYMPMEATFGEDEENTTTKATTPKGASFSGGRPRAKPGDIYIKGRDGNFVTLHRGGVLCIGSTPLAQRIYIPLGNLITDYSQNYQHFNAAGSINWGIRQNSDNPESEHKQTFRVYANDEFADIRIAAGKVQMPVLEPNGEAGSSSDLSALSIGKPDPVVFELVVAPGGFDTTAGTPESSTQNGTKLRLFFDRAGGTMFRTEASVSLRIKKKLRLRVDDTMEVFGKKSITMESKTSMRLFAKDLVEVGTSGGVLKLNGGTKPVAHVGSIVRITVGAPVPIVVGGVSGTISSGAIFDGVVTTGNPTINV